MKRNEQLLEKEGVEIVEDGSFKCYFYDDELIAMDRDGIRTIMQTFEVKVSDLINLLMTGSGFSHYLHKGVNYIVLDTCSSRYEMDKTHSWRL